jgi:protein SCO1/2
MFFQMLEDLESRRTCSMNKRDFLRRSLGLTAGAAMLGVAGPSLAESKYDLNRRQSLIPNTKLKTQDGRVVQFYDDLVKDKVVVFNFFFASCRDSCPMTTHNISRVQKLLGDRVGKDIFIYSITLDPDHDRPELLKSYASLFNVGPGWTFLTGVNDSGNQADIDYLRKRLGFADLDPVLDRQRESHIGMLRFGNERRGQWGAMPATMTPKLLAKEILWLLPDTRAEDIRKLAAL